MPTYGYRCGSCGHEFEVLQKMSDHALTTCPKCAGKLSKKIYAAGIIYKGSGYYNTDYKGGGTSSDKSGESGDKSSANGSEGGSGGSEGAGESKTATESKSESSESKSESKSESTTSKSDSSTEKAS